MSQPDVPVSGSGRLSPTLGDQPWFDIPIRLAIFLLGAAHLSFNLSGATFDALLIVLGLYGAATAYHILHWVPALRPRLAAIRRQWDLGAREQAVLNYLVDIAFIVAVTAVSERGHTILLPVLIMLAGARYFGWLAGPPSPFIVLAFVPPVFFYVVVNYEPIIRPGIRGGRLVEPTILCCLLVIGYVFTRKLNASIAGAAELENEIADRDQRLGQAARRAEHDATRLAQQVLRLQVLQDGIAAVNSAIDLSDLLQMVVSNAVRVLEAEQSSIGLLDEQTGELVIQAATGAVGSTLRRQQFAPGVGVAGWVVQHGEPLMIGDVRLDSRYVDLAGDDPVRPTTRSMLCVPLKVERRVIGALSVTHSAPHALTEDDQRWLLSFAEQAALAVHKTRLLEERTRQHEELQRRAEDNARLLQSLTQQQQQAAALYRLMLKVSDAHNRRQLAAVVCAEIAHIAGAPAAALLGHDEEQSRLICWAASGTWAGRPAVLEASLSGQGDPFLSNLLLLLQQRESPDLPMVPGVPMQLRPIFSGRCVTLPLTLGNRVYGLLILQAPADPPLGRDVKETINLAVSHCTVALERAELFEQTLASAQQSVLLQSMASGIQTSLDPATVLQATASGSLSALPIDSCEVYIFDAARAHLHLVGRAVSPPAESAGWRGGPATVALAANPVLQTVLAHSDLLAGDLEGAAPARSTAAPTVLLGRLMGSEMALGVIRLTTAVPTDDFVRRHGTFCQTLWMYSGGALERSRLYTTAARQARMLRQRAQQLTDILNLGNLSAADGSLAALLPELAAGIARSLGFAYVGIGQLAAEPGPAEPAAAANWPLPGRSWADLAPAPAPAISAALLERLLRAGRTPEPGFAGVYLDESTLLQALGLAVQAANRPATHPVILLPLSTRAGELLGYLLAAPAGDAAPRRAPLDHELREVLTIFAQRIALILENHVIYDQLLTSKRKIEAVVLSISDGVIVTDAELKVLITNSLADQLLQVPATESYGYPLGRFLEHPALIEQLETCLVTGKATTADVDLPLGRERRTYQATAHSITTADVGSLGAVLTLRDVTLERATERAKSDFLSVVSHELRTPLNSIMGFLDIILMGKTGALTELQTDFLGTAKQESLVLQRLIDDVLDYSQIQIRMLRVEMVPMDLSAAVVRVVNQAVPRMTDDELRLINNVPPGLLVLGDEMRLEQVFKNLLDNAAKFTDPGGEIRFAAQVDTQTVTIRVTDTGCGIPQAQIGAVFDRFFQAENNSNRHTRGLGLGLAICKSIVDAHNGRIWIESDLGVGTTVGVELLRFQADHELYDFELSADPAALSAWR